MSIGTYVFVLLLNHAIGMILTVPCFDNDCHCRIILTLVRPHALQPKRRELLAKVLSATVEEKVDNLLWQRSYKR